jgi:cytochrome c biogenesis factor
MDEDKAKMDPKTKAIVILFVLLLIGAVIGFAISKFSLDYIYENSKDKMGPNARASRAWQMYSDIYTLGTIIICMNLLLLIGLLGSYVDSFRKTKSSFILGLILFLGVLFVQSALSLPILSISYGHQISLISILPNMFETIALIILFYLSME